MSKANAATVLISGLLLLSGCNRNANTAATATTPAATAAPPAAAAPAPVAAEATPTINASMTKVMSVHAQTIWDITSRAFNARGDGLVASKISARDWAQLAEAGQQLKDRALLLAAARQVTVAGPGETILGADAAGQPARIGHAWDALSAGQVQTRIDGNPAFFSQHARTLAQAGDTVVKASRIKDVRMLYGVSSGLDEVCDGCHQKVWGTDEPPPFPKSK
jgi:hypothetical protein